MQKKGWVTVISIASAVILIMAGIILFNDDSAKSEAEIKEDIRAINPYFVYGLEFDEFTITQRQTNTESKTDYVWVEFVASNEEFSYWAWYSIDYILYNDGWEIGDYCCTDEDYLALNPESISENDARFLIEESSSYQDYDSIEFVSRENNDNRIVFTYEGHVKEGYLDTTYSKEVVYEFSPTESWKGVCNYGRGEEITIEVSDELLGVWQSEKIWHEPEMANNFEGYYTISDYLRIIDIDIDEGWIECEYKYSYDSKTYENNNGVLGKKGCWYKESGIQRFDLHKENGYESTRYYFYSGFGNVYLNLGNDLQISGRGNVAMKK